MTASDMTPPAFHAGADALGSTGPRFDPSAGTSGAGRPAKKKTAKTGKKVAKKAASKKTVSKKAVTKKASGAKTTKKVAKTTASKPASTKAASKKAATKKTGAKASAKPAPAKSGVKAGVSKKAAGKKTVTKKPAGAVASKASSTKSPAKSPAKPSAPAAKSSKPSKNKPGKPKSAEVAEHPLAGSPSASERRSPSEPRREEPRESRGDTRHENRNEGRRNEPRRDDRRDGRGSPSGGATHAEPRADGPDSGAKPGRKRRRRRGRGGREDAGQTQAAPNQNTPNQNANTGPREPRADRPERDAAPATERPARTPAPAALAGDASQDVFDKGTFDDLGLDESVLRGIKAQGFIHPTAIQAKLIPVALTGRDVLGQAKTGTGKTAAFGLPLLHLAERGRKFQALVLAPTRELAVQIADEMKELGRHTGLRVLPVYGGQKIQTQAEKLAKGPEIIVGTPGRVMDMVQRGYLSLADVRFAILDEVDRMFDIGFREDIRRILRMCPEDRQTIFVSATINPEIEELARRHMREPEKIVTSSGSLTVSLVDQFYLTVEPWDKRNLLVHLLTHEEPALTIVFCRLKKTVDRLTEHLNKKGIEAHAIHGDMRQGRRTSVMKAFKGGKLACLVASDLASRGIDVENISHVVNYDLPDDPDLYVHRIGRTARAGKRGIAWSFATPAEGKLLRQIENLINAEVPHLAYPDFEPTPRPDGWKDERPNAPYVVTGVPVVERNRLGAPDVPAKAQLDERSAASKFPGGVVPSKLPPKLMGGRVRTRR